MEYRSLINYGIFDGFAKLAISSGKSVVSGFPVSAVHDAFMHPSLGTPTTISWSGAKIAQHPNKEVITAEKIKLLWEDETGLNRVNGPAMVVIDQPSYLYMGGKLLIASFNYITGCWWKNGSVKREIGPWLTTLKAGNCSFNPEGSAEAIPQIETVLFHWNHPGGGVISETLLDEARDKLGIKIHIDSSDLSVFESEMDEAMFYGTVLG